MFKRLHESIFFLVCQPKANVLQILVTASVSAKFATYLLWVGVRFFYALLLTVEAICSKGLRATYLSRYPEVYAWQNA